MGLAFFYTLFSYTEGCILNTTDNYQLNQWEGTDRILRTDFNADNLKTDDAVAELRAELAAAVAACPIVKLMDISTQEATSQIDLDLSSTDLTPYRALLVELYPGADSSPSTNGCIRCNGLTSIYHRNDSTSNGLTDFNLGVNTQAALINAQIALMPGGLVGLTLHSHWNKTGSYHYTDCLEDSCGTIAVNKSTLQALNIVVISKDLYLGRGTRVILRGIKL